MLDDIKSPELDVGDIVELRDDAEVDESVVDDQDDDVTDAVEIDSTEDDNALLDNAGRVDEIVPGSLNIELWDISEDTELEVDSLELLVTDDVDKSSSEEDKSDELDDEVDKSAVDDANAIELDDSTEDELDSEVDWIAEL
jgi:hypothetical protein